MDAAGAPGRQTGYRAEQGALIQTMLDNDQDVLARSDLDARRLEGSPTARESEAGSVQNEPFGRMDGHRDPIGVSTGRLGRL